MTALGNLLQLEPYHHTKGEIRFDGGEFAENFRMTTPLHLLLFYLMLALALTVGVGCRSTVSFTNTAASASQQLLLNSSVDAVVCSFDFGPLVDRLCYLNTSGLGAQSEGYLAYRIRQEMILQGVRLTEASDDAEVIVEAGLAAYGTDSQRDEVGITEADLLPDLYLCIRGTQYGVAKLSMFAWEQESGRAVWRTPLMRADSYQEVRKVLGTGPYYSGTIQNSADRIQR